ncbi:MAG TPA: DUF4112 domain-containing protein [Thermoanaerobaculia bacterium]|nr:DUF4112 domain-containing protein [Thermoanaerobaculia bacterium]
MARQKVIIPEVIEPDEKLPRDLVALRRFAHFMDEAVPIPGTTRRIGFDAAIGFIPGFGDAVGAILSTWIIIGALRHRVPLLHVARMIVNVLLDLAVGAIPLFGDIFDIAFEENVMNLKLLLRHRDRSRAPRTFAAIAFVAALIVAFIAAAAVAVIIALIVFVIWLANQR